jgi:hypothetical protein
MNHRAIETSAYHRALDAARDAKAGDRMAAMAVAVHAFADQIWSEAGTSPGEASPAAACAAGCSWCCRQQVAVAPAEALAIAAHVERRFDAVQRDAALRRVAALDQATRGLSALDRGRLKLPCAFLLEGQCSIYAVRPLRCRGVYSRDATHCRSAMENPDEAAAARRERNGPGPFFASAAKIMDAALTGLARASRDCGLDDRSLELTAAVRIAITVPEAERHLSGGVAALDAAVLPERAGGVAGRPFSR